MSKMTNKWAVAAVTALLLLGAQSFGQDESPANLLAEQYLALAKLLSAKEYDKAFSESKKLIERAPHFDGAYSKFVDAAQKLGQLELAESYFYDSIKQTPPNPRAYYGLALIQRNRKLPEQVIENAQQCLALLPSFTPAYSLLVNTYSGQKKQAEAEVYLRSMTKISTVAFYGLGRLYYLQEKWAESKAALEQAPDLYDPRLLIGLLYLRDASYAEALQIFQSLLPGTATELDHRLYIQLYLGFTYAELGDNEESVKALEDAYHLAKELSNISMQEECLLKFGHTYQRQAKYDLALRHWLDGLSLARASRDKQNVGVFLGNIGLYYRRIGNSAQAIDYYRQAIQFAQESKRPESQATFLTNLGVVHAELNAYPEAKNCFDRAIEITRQLRNPALESAALSELANLYFKQKDYQAALRTQSEALQLAHKVQSPLRQGNSLNSLGALHFRMSNWQEARRSYEEALELSAKFDMPQVLWQAHSGLAAVYDQQGERGKAQDHYRQAIAAMENIRALLGGADEKAGYFQDKVEVHKKLIAALLKPVGNGFERSGAEEAFHIAERARARALADLLAEAAANLEQTLSPGLQQSKQSLDQRIIELNKQLLKERTAATEKQNRARLVELEKKQGDVDKELAAWVQEVRQQNPSFADLKYPEPLNLPEAQRLLDDRTILLSYVLGEDASYLFAVGRQQYQVARLPAAAARLRGQVTELLGAIKGQDARLERRLASTLYSELLGPVDELKLWQGKKHVIIVADDALHRLPFEVLLQPDTKQYLVERLAISYAPSVTVLASLQRERRALADQQDFLAFANPVYEERGAAQDNSVIAGVLRGTGDGQQWRLKSLRNSRKEAEEIAKLFAPQKATVLLGAEASEEAVKTRPDVSASRVLHFSAHGLVNEDLPRFSSVVLSLPQRETKTASGEDGFLSAYEIFNLKLNAELVTLSACDTGLGKEVKGEGLMSLVRAFMYAGSQSVLATLWKVDDESAANLMIDFYWHWQQGKLTKAEALRQAQIKAIRMGSAPKFWAPFALIGRAD